MTGKIVKGIAGFYYVHDGGGKVYECKAKGVFRNRRVKPMVGDNVVFSLLEQEAAGNIDALLPRANQLVRPAVSNVDQALVIFSLDNPQPNLNLLDRFLVMMGVQQVPTAICFNKMDLLEEGLCQEFEKIYGQAGYPVYFTSAFQDKGLDQIRCLIRGKTTVLAGPSGVGKSSITNLIQPHAAMAVGAVSEKIKRGRHTTRHSELFYVEEGTYILDTPGFSSMDVQDLDPGQLKDYFPEFQAYEGDCKFLGCVHIGERVCAVKEAVAQGRVSPSRYGNYKLFYQELKDRKKY